MTSNDDRRLEAPYQDSLRNGEAVEAHCANLPDEYEIGDTPESDEALRLWDEHHREWENNYLVRLFRRLVGK